MTEFDNSRIERGIKSLDLGNGEFIYFWYSNNRGRGTDNCTIIRSSAPRASMSARQSAVIAKTFTSAWAGKVNFSAAVKKALGL
jgi:hypothetical protein